MTICGVQMDGSLNDTRHAKIIRATWGAFYGFLMGVAFVLIAAFIDLWLHPDLPLGVNWQLLWTRLPLFALGMALVGAVTCWWNEAWTGLLSGAAAAAALALAVALFTSNDVTAGMKFIVLVFILIPFAAMMLPITWVMRWLVEHHARSLQLNWSYGRIAGLILLAALLGSTGGYFMKMSGRQLEVTRYVHALLQGTNVEQSPISKVKGMSEHEGIPYRLYSAKSAFSTEGFDVRAEFEDGYVLKCTAVLYPGRPPYLTSCSSDK
jgi:hypothetical protein